PPPDGLFEPGRERARECDPEHGRILLFRRRVPQGRRRMGTTIRRFLPPRADLAQPSRAAQDGQIMGRAVALLVVPPVDELDLVGPLEVFGTANRIIGGRRPQYEVQLMTTMLDRKI